MKRTYLVAILVGLAINIYGITNASAEATTSQSNEIGSLEHHQHPKFNLVEATQKHLNTLKSKLVLNSSQTNAWSSYATFKIEKAKLYQEKWATEKHKRNFKDYAGITTPELIDLRINHAEKQIKRLENHKSSL